MPLELDLVKFLRGMLDDNDETASKTGSGLAQLAYLAEQPPLVVTRYRQFTVVAGDNTTAWRQLSGSLGQDVFIVGVGHTRGTDPSSGADPGIIEVAKGAAGSETVIVDDVFINSEESASSNVLVEETKWLPIPVKVSSGTRLAARILNQSGAAFNWGANVPNLIVYHFRDSDIAQ